jgi:two-component system phosphate regulon response regulator OmpR
MPHRAAGRLYTSLVHSWEGRRAAMNSKPLILIVDDDAELSGMVVELLQREGWATHAVLTGGDGERDLAALHPELVLLDVMLPDANGYELCRRWRASNAGLGIVMLTARGDPLDRVLGLEIGADDYLAAPGRAESPLMRFDGLVIDLLRREVRVGEQALALTSVEFKLLVALARAPGSALSRETLSDAVQVGSYRPQDRTVDVQVARLRRKLQEVRPGADWIDTVRGEGYVFVPR